MSGRPTAAQVSAWAEEIETVGKRIGGHFARSEPRRRAVGYVSALLGNTERKNGWQLAEHPGDSTPDNVQHLLARADRDADAARDDLLGYARECLSHPDGVPVVDETGFLKEGSKSCGVARQYSGTAGRIESGRVGVFPGYAAEKGRAPVDRALYLPKEWATRRNRSSRRSRSCNSSKTPSAGSPPARRDGRVRDRMHHARTRRLDQMPGTIMLAKTAVTFVGLAVATLPPGTPRAAADDPPARFTVTSRKADDTVTVGGDHDRTVFEIRSPSGISRAAVERKGDAWPKAVVVRLHLTGLENLTVSNGAVAVHSAVGLREGKVEVRQWKAEKDETPLAADDPLRPAVRVLGKEGKPAAGSHSTAGTSRSRSRPRDSRATRSR